MYLQKGVLEPMLPELIYTEDEYEIITSVGADLDPMFREYQQTAVIGTIDIDATWDKYVADLEAYGLSDMVAAYQSAYDRYLAEYGN
jgi:putative aldouronate transport system substrate-binding protein